MDNAGIAADIESDINTALGSDKVTVEWTGSNYKFMSNLGTSSGSVVIASPGANLSSLNLGGKGWVGAETSAISSNCY